MKKLVRNLFAVIAATALVGSLASCADSDAEDPFATTSTNANTGSGTAGGNGGAGNGGGDNGNQGVQGAGEILPGYKAAKITFDVTEDSTNDEDTVLLIKYDRSAAGADELIKVTNTDLTVKLNGTVIKTFDKINFALDEYGASFDDSDKNPIKNSANQKEYKDKLSIGKTVKKGDKVEVSFTRFVAEGSGLEAIGADPTKIQIALIDKNQNAGGKADSYYNELCKDGEYTSIFEAAKKEENTPKPPKTGDDAIELVEPAAKSGYFTFWAQSSGAKEGSVMFIVNYESATLNKAVELTNVDIEYIINNGTAKHYTENISIPKNQYGTDYQAKVPLFADYKVTKNDAIYVKITAKVNEEAAASIIQGNLIDTDESVSYWKEMCLENQQKQVLSGITYEAGSGAGGNGQAAPTIVATLSLPVNTKGEENRDYGVQLHQKLSEIGITDITELKAGEVYTIHMKGSVSGATNLNDILGGLSIEWDGWNKGGMDGGFNISEASLATGFSKDVTIKSKTGENEDAAGTVLTGGDIYFWLYNEASGTTPTTLSLTEFSITKKN